MEDALLMKRVGEGDRGAFNTLFERHRACVLRLARRFAPNPARAEELAQDVFIKLYTRAASYRPTAAFKTFLYRIAINHCLNELRRGEHKVERATAPEPLDEHPTSVSLVDRPDEVAEAKELAAALAQALERLNDKERLAFSLCRFEGLSYADVARTLGVSDSAVKSLIHRASLAVAKQLDSRKLGPNRLRSTA